MRMDWFLPTLRSNRRGVTPRVRSRFYRVLQRILPKVFFSSTQTMRFGLLRRMLRKMGPVWTSAPLRRAVQSACFIAFLVLFFYVCWPYSATPASGSPGWYPIEFDYQRQLVSLENSDTDAFTLLDGRGTDHSWLIEDVLTGSLYGRVGESHDTVDRNISLSGPAVTIIAVQSDEVEIKLEGIDPASLDELSVSPGPWTLHAVDPTAWPSHYADHLAKKELIDAEMFLAIDPLVSLSTAIASGSWVWSLVTAMAILAACVLIPRGFCGYLCPLGTLIDFFDWCIGRHIRRFRVSADGWWVHIRFYLLGSILVSACAGVLISGYFSAIPVITRGMQFTVAPLQNGVSNGWHQIPPWNMGQVLSVVMFLGVLGLGFLRPRFWCKYVCPSGAVFSVGNLLRISERKVDSSCIHCNKCVEICPFDAIKPDFTTRTLDCTLCQSCGGVCPTHSITFTGRWDFVELKTPNQPPTHETALGRRGFLSAGVGTTLASAGGLLSALGMNRSLNANVVPVRPPGSVPEDSFLQMCIRCGECFKACPSDVLQPLGFEQGLDGLWTPHVVADWAGCAASCNGCGQVCPTGAIRALPLEEKRWARMGLAEINTSTCLPWVGREACQLCVDECDAAGYRAIEFVRIGTRMDSQGNPIEGTGFLSPLLIPDLCVGCGLCQTRCHGINVADGKLLNESAIIIRAGGETEDRIFSGSYRELAEARRRS